MRRDGEPVVQVLFKTIGKAVDPTFSSLLPCPSGDSTCGTGTVPSSTTTTTVICQSRTPASSYGCNYSLPGGSQSVPQVNFGGMVSNLGTALASSWQPSSMETMVLTGNKGGACINPSGFASGGLTPSSGGGTTFSWTETMSFTVPSTQPCLNNTNTPGSGVVNLSASFDVMLAGSPPTPSTFSVNSQSGSCVSSSYGTACIYPLTIYWGCLVAGTPVVMADGSAKKSRTCWWAKRCAPTLEAGCSP